MTNTVLAWHFIATRGTLRDGSKAKRIERHAGDLVLCQSGLHASVRAIDALSYAPGNILRRVECRGRITHGSDKLVCSERRVLWTADATNTLHEFACWCAEQALTFTKEKDERCWNAIKVKRLWIAGKATDAELAAARAAAWDAARAAARDAARDAARAAARAAAMDAAWDAAWDAARDAARAAAWDDQNTKLEELFMALEPKKARGRP